jgi:hypothetical protein
VSVTRGGAYLVMQVKNSSPGGVPPIDASAGTGLGIRNLQERLATIYKDSFRFTYGHDAEGAWISTVEIPYSERIPA